MQFIMYPYGGQSAILTDDYSPSEIVEQLHIKHLRADMERIGGVYPAKVYTGSMKPYAFLYADKVEFCKSISPINKNARTL